MYVVVSKLKKLAKEHEASLSAEALAALSEEIKARVEAAVETAKAEGRKVVKAKHL